MRLDVNSPRLNNFDFIRFCLAVTVIFSHSFDFTGWYDYEPVRVLCGTTAGKLAVAGFFSISGYLIFASWQRRSGVLDYVKKRVTRIYPAWIVVNLLAVVGCLAFAVSTWQDVLEWLPIAPLLQRFESVDAFPNNAYPGHINGSLWTIPHEFACYTMVLLLGICGMLSTGRRLLLCTTAVILAWLLDYAFHWAPNDAIERFLTMCPFFFVGACFYEFREKMTYNEWWLVASMAGFGLAAVVPILRPLVMPVSITYAILYLAFQQRVTLHNFGKYGDFSYGIYLYSFPIQQILIWLNGGTMHPVTLFLVSTPVSILAGIASWYGVERWWLAKKRRREVPHHEEAYVAEAS